jgi:hypothetical protein
MAFQILPGSREDTRVNPTGTLTYSFYNNASCTQKPASTQKVTVAGGLAPHSHPTGHLAAGSYSYRAAYSGSPSYLASRGACEHFTVH